MTRIQAIALAAATSMLSACAGAGGLFASEPLAPAAAETAAQSLLEADRAFAAHAQSAGIEEAWAAVLAPDATLLSANEPPVEGAAAIVDVMGQMPEGAVLDWVPAEALVSGGGDFGVTWGDYRVVAPSPAGSPAEQSGRYLTVWRKDVRGAWRVVLDFGV